MYSFIFNKSNKVVKININDSKSLTTVDSIKQNDSSKIQIKSSNEINNESGLYPEGSNRYLSSSDLSGKSKYDLKIMRNEIFARHGFIFQTNEMQDYFSKQSWYNPRYSDVNNMLTSIEKDNIALIKKFEN